ncbi:MAG: GNAT family N-acetyltransferase [Polyangiales bacterium]
MDAVTIRPARDDDYKVYTRLLAQLGTGDPAPPPSRWTDEIRAQTFCAERDGAVLGYVFGQSLAGVGYVRNLVTDVSARRQGVGRALMQAIAARFRADGCARWCLNVKPDNRAALALYEALGLRAVYRGASLRITWEALRGLPDAPAEVVADVCREAHDDAVEAHWDLARGQLAYARAHGWVLRRVGLTEGVACFNPTFPGVFPFRAASLGAASALLTALRPHALPEHDHVRLMVEADDGLRAALESLGAEVALETLHLRGEIPA